MWSFSIHIKERMKERAFSSSEILKIVNEEVITIIIQSPKDEVVDLHFGKVGRKHILVVVNRKTQNLITVRSMRKKEIKYYSEEIEND